MASPIDVVIVTRDRYELTESCLRHLAAQTAPHHVIVVDNGSVDGTPERLREQWPGVVVLVLGEPSGFATACNHGVVAGDSEIVVLLNNDVDCEPELLEQLAAPFADDPALGSAAALMLQPGGTSIDSIGLAADSTLAAFPRLQGQPAEHAAATRPLLAGPAGAAAAYRRQAWQELGGMDERLHAYMEDFEIALRLAAAGWRTIAVPRARGVHLGSASHGHRSASQRRLGGFGRGYVLRRHAVLRSRAAVRTLLTEAAVVLGDLAISRDFVALRGRIEGYRAARGLARLAPPPADVVDAAITLRQSLRLRRAVYSRRAA